MDGSLAVSSMAGTVSRSGMILNVYLLRLSTDTGEYNILRVLIVVGHDKATAGFFVWAPVIMASPPPRE
eukprot:scaffold4603_cov175-Amphora_coffeaeformis.AAC.7